MLSLINRFRVDERGATATEYAMLIVFIALAIAVGCAGVRQRSQRPVQTVGTYPLPA